MKVTRFLLSVLFVGAMATTASAQGAVSLNWDTCTGPIGKSIAPGSSAQLFASVLGHTQPHSAYQVVVSLGSGSAGAIRDAWRFDAAGCQGSSLILIDHLAPGTVSKVCPSFQGPLASIQIKDYSYDALTGKCRATMANTYPAGNTAQINPATRYFLAAFKFDHLFSVVGPADPAVACGGLEVPVCAHLTKGNWLPIGGVGDGNPWAIASEYVLANDPNNDSRCPGATPTKNTTWGSIKDQYKR